MKRQFNKKLIIGIIIAAAVATTGIISAVIIFQPQPQSQENLDSRINGLMSQGDIPSFAAGIVINDTIVWSKGYGDQPDLDTVYMIGSMTKMFTATAIMQLYDNSTIDLDTDINTYLPFSVRHPSYVGTPITTRMLLTHRSGISHDVSDGILWDMDADWLNWSNNILGTNYTLWDPRPSLGDFLNGSLNPAGLYYETDNWKPEPGTQWHYSNTGFLLLSYIVEQITNKPFAQYLQDNVFDPLNMNNTGYNYTDFTGRNAIPYELYNNENFASPLYNSYNFGGGGLRSTVPDLANFLIAHMNQGSYNTSQILQPLTVDLMQTAQFSMSGIDFGGFTFSGHGLGWPLYTNNLIGHTGAIPGYLADMTFKTVSNGKYGIVFMLNRGSSLVVDDFLVNTFFPSMINILLDEAARLFAM